MLNIAIIGVTHWHTERYVQMLGKRGARFVGASDIDPVAGAKAAARYGIDFTPDTADMLAKARPDFTVVVPRHDRALIEVQAVLDRRLPMLVEKPLGRNATEARATADAINEAGVFATTCFPNRHLEIWDVYRDLTDKGALGTVIHAHFRTINGPPARYIEYGVPWMLDPALSGGGGLRNLGIHAADAIAMLAGNRALRLIGGGTTHIGYTQQVEDFGAGIFAANDGFMATLEAGYSYAAMQEGGDYEWRIAATGAYLQEANGILVVRHRDGQREERKVYTPGVAYEIMVNAAIDGFQQGRPPPAPVDDCVRAVGLQDMIYEAARTRAAS
jgi:predicted dehydrogenase